MKTWLEAYAPGPVVRVNADYAVPASNGQIVVVTALSVASTITLPATPVLGQIVAVKRASLFDCAVTIAGNGAMIDGASSLALAGDYGAVYLAWTGIGWASLAAYTPAPDLTLTTTDDTATTIATLALETLRVYAISVEGIAVSSATKIAYKSVFRVMTDAESASESGTVIEVHDKLTPWSASLDFDGLSCEIQMTGAAGTEVRWAARVSVQSVTGFVPE